jgi:hypothetical protein
MKLGKSAFVLTLFFFSLNARADMTGSWSGSGMLTSKEGAGETSTSCEKIQFGISETATEFSINQGNWQCGPTSENYQPLAMQIIENGLWYDGQEVGEIGSDYLKASVTTDGVTESWSVQLSSDQNSITFTDVRQDGANVMTVTGILKR